MADLTITASDVAVVKAIEQFTVPAHEVLAAGNAAYLVAATGKAGKADANGAAPINEPEGVAIKSAFYANEAVTIIQQGWVDLGAALDGLNYGDPVWLSNTAGALADADPGAGIIVGEVWPAFGAATADKILRVAVKTLADIAPNSITNSMLAGGFMNVTLVAGGAAGNHTVTGIATGDELVFVGHLSTAAAIATLADLTSEFTVSAADTINNAAGTDTTNDQLMVIWLDLT
jgi:hypothetical protein